MVKRKPKAPLAPVPAKPCNVKAPKMPESFVPAYGSSDILDLQLAYKHDQRILDLLVEYQRAVEHVVEQDSAIQPLETSIKDLKSAGFDDMETIGSDLNTLVNYLIDDLTDSTRADSDTVADVVKRQEEAMAKLLERRQKLADYIDARMSHYEF